MIVDATMYSLFTPKASIMSIETLSKSAHSEPKYRDKPKVKAATILNVNSSTEIVHVSTLLQNLPPLTSYVEIADASGKLYCINRQISTSCWLKIITIAEDCQSCNVMLMPTNNGVVLKAVRSITPGEPLLMWFTEPVLCMLNMPYLTDVNIKDQNRYICHLCDSHFESPNPLKIHLALNCNRLDSNYLWAQLAKEFISPPLRINFFETLPAFGFDVKNSAQMPPVALSPASIETSQTAMSNNINSLLNNSSSYSHHSPSPTNPDSPTLSGLTSPVSPSRLSVCSPASLTTQIMPPMMTSSHSAFVPYMNRHNDYAPRIMTPHTDKPMLGSCQVYPTINKKVLSSTEAAHIETVVSNYGKVKNGHQCCYCGKIYSRKYGLKIHVRTHTGFKPLKCKFCNRAFGDPSNLNKHERLHSEGETPYKCDICGKVLVRKRDLERHVKSRHRENIDQNSDVSTDGIDNF